MLEFGMIILNLLVFVIILGSIIAIHELGHLIFAKKAKILCFEYSLGFGPKIYSKKGEETEFSIRAIPLGGFVSMAGEFGDEFIKDGEIIGLNLEDGKVKEIILTDKVKSEILIKVTKHEIYDEEETNHLFIEGIVDGEEKRYEVMEEAFYILGEKRKMQIAPYNRSFESKTYLQKFLTLLAGPLMNFVLAIFLFFVVAAIQGKPQNNNVVGKVAKDFPASVVGIKKGDKIISIDDNLVEKWSDLSVVYGNLNSYENVKVEIKRGEETIVEYVDFAIDLIRIGIANFADSKVIKNETLEEGIVVGTGYGKTKDILKKGDIIQQVKYNDVTTTITSWHDLVELVKTMDGGTAEVIFLREVDGTNKTMTKTIQAWEDKFLNSQGYPSYNVMLGVDPQTKFSLGYSLTQPFVSAWNSFYQVITIVGFLFGGSKQVGVSDLSGRVGIFNVIGKMMSQGFLTLLAFTAFLSVNVGVLNLLPIPALDGGRMLFITIEAVTRKKIPKKVDNLVNNIFFFLLMGLLIYVTINDIIRL